MKNLEFTKELLEELRQKWIDNECIFCFESEESAFHEIMGRVLFVDDLDNVKKIIAGYLDGNVKGEYYPKEKSEDWLTLNIVEQEIKKLKGE